MIAGLSASERRQIVEATLTPDAFLRELVDRKVVKLPARRYRVEHAEPGQGGNSYILNLDDAKETQRVFGGAIIELVSTTTFYRATAKHLEHACEECNAARGQPCLTNPEEPSTVCEPHPVRLGKTTRADRAALKLPDCPACKAKAGRPCRTAGGRKQMPHRQRLPPKPKKLRVPVKDLAACATCGANAGEACRTTNPTFPGSADPNARVPKVKTHAGRSRRTEAA